MTPFIHNFRLNFVPISLSFHAAKCPALLNRLQYPHEMHLPSIPMGLSQIRNLRTTRAVQIGTHLSRLRKKFQSPNRPS